MYQSGDGGPSVSAISFGTLMTSWMAPATAKDEALKKMTAANTHATTQATAIAWSKASLKGHENAVNSARFTGFLFWYRRRVSR
jgi:hypothetical protein